MSSIVDSAREILAGLAPEIPSEEITDNANLADDLRLDPLTRYALAFQLERALKIQIPDTRIEKARTITDLVTEDNPSE